MHLFSVCIWHSHMHDHKNLVLENLLVRVILINCGFSTSFLWDPYVLFM